MSSSYTARQGAQGGGVTIAGGLGALLIQFASVAVMSRLLEPRDFGLIAMAQVITALGVLLRDFGLPTVALQQRNLSNQQASNLFWASTVLALGVTALLALSAPLVASFYGEPVLMSIVPAMSLTVLFSGIGAQVRVSLARRLRFRTLVVSDLVSLSLALAAGVTLALNGAGYWALVVQNLVSAGLLLLIQWIASRWVPMRYRRGHGSLAHMKAAADYGFVRFLSFAHRNAAPIIIGRELGAVDLGLYNRGNNVLNGPVGRLLNPLTRVSVPILNRAAAEGKDYGPLLLRAQFAVAVFFAVPLATAIGTAPALVPLLLGEGWEAVVPIFQILAVGAYFQALELVNSWVFMVYGRSRGLLRVSAYTKPLAIVCVVVGAFFGLQGVTWGLVAGFGLDWVVQLFWLKGAVHLASGRFIANACLILLAGALATGAAWWTFSLTTFFIPVASIAVASVAAVLAIVCFLLILSFTRRQLLATMRFVRLALPSRK